MKLFPNFTSVPFNYLLISWVTNYDQNRGSFDIVHRTSLNFEFSSQFSELFDKIPNRIILDVLFSMFRFSRASYNALTSSFTAF